MNCFINKGEEKFTDLQSALFRHCWGPPCIELQIARGKMPSTTTACRIVDMSGSNSAEFAGLFRSNRQTFLEHGRSKAELKILMPEDAREAIGHGVRAKRSKSGAISFDLLVAAASAKAQAQLANPEKSLVGAIRSDEAGAVAHHGMEIGLVTGRANLSGRPIMCRKFPTLIWRTVIDGE